MSSLKTLFVVRHAKSSWDYENISDIDRPLKIRGIRDAYEMARRLKIGRNTPAHFITSPANRAFHTATIFLNVFELTFDRLKVDHRLYGHGAGRITELLKNQPAGTDKLAIFGHNPDFSELAAQFSQQAMYELPTCGIAIFTFECDSWQNIGKDTVIGESFDFPKKDQ